MKKPVAMPGLLQLLRAASADRSDLDLNCLDATVVQQAVDRGLGPLLFRATKNNPRSSASSLQSILLSADITSRILVHEQLDGL